MSDVAQQEEMRFCLKTRFRTFLKVRFFCVTVWLYSTPNKCEDHFFAYIQRFCRVGGGRLKAFLFYSKVENFMQDMILFVIDFAIFSSKQN